MRHLRPTIHRQTGASIVALMVGIAIGLFILAGALTLYTNHVQNNRALMLSMRLNQELRAVADLVARDLKRAGHWKNAVAGIASENATGAINTYTSIENVGTPNAAELSYKYAVDTNNAVSNAESFGFRLQNGVIQMTRDNGATWDNLTDEATTTVTNFAIVAINRTVATTQYCQTATPVTPPALTIRVFRLTIAGQSKADATIARTVEESVRVRSDLITGACT